jgi:hypothetical protein
MRVEQIMRRIALGGPRWMQTCVGPADEHGESILGRAAHPWRSRLNRRYKQTQRRSLDQVPIKNRTVMQQPSA